MAWLDEGVRIEQQGVWACLDWQKEARVPLALAFALHVAPTIKYGHLPLAGTVEESLIELDVSSYGRAIAGPVAGKLPTPEVREKATRLAPLLTPILSLLLYLCDEAADIRDGRRIPQKPKPKQTKGQERVFPAPAPFAWSVGVRMGAALRHAKQREAAQAAEDEAAGRRTVRPHVRRAHWAHRWTGPMNGERKAVVRWIHPALVNAPNPEALPSVIRPVEGAA